MLNKAKIMPLTQFIETWKGYKNMGTSKFMILFKCRTTFVYSFKFICCGLLMNSVKYHDVVCYSNTIPKV